MASFNLTVTDGFTVAVQYNAQGKVTALEVTNRAPYAVYAEARLTDGRVFGQTFQPGPLVGVNFPNNAVSVTFDAQGEPVWTGLASISTRTLGT